MFYAISTLIIIVCALLILIVLVQNSKGGGLSSTFASSNQIMGVRKTTDFLEKATWTLAGSLFVLCIVAAMFVPKEETGSKSAIQDQLNNAPVTSPVIPNFPGAISESADEYQLPAGESGTPEDETPEE